MSSIDPNAAHIRPLRRRVDERLAGLIPDAEPDSLYAPARYVLAGRGKRVRPVLLLLAAEASGAAAEAAMPAALAVEVFHNFTLVHDDIMDHAAERRGRPTVHERWDESTAILVGDLLMALAYELLAEVEAGDTRRMTAAYQRMVRQLCEGQALDKAFETRADVTVDEYLRMIDAKTGALVAAVLAMGAHIAGSPHAGALFEAGRHVGRAFQIQDDLLDLVASDDRWGKPVGGDLVEGKKTFLLLRALERARGDERAWYARIVHDGGLSPGEVPEARRRMEALGVVDEAREAVKRYSEAAHEQLARLPGSDALLALHGFVERMQARVH